MKRKFKYYITFLKNNTYFGGWKNLEVVEVKNKDEAYLYNSEIDAWEIIASNFSFGYARINKKIVTID